MPQGPHLSAQSYGRLSPSRLREYHPLPVSASLTSHVHASEIAFEMLPI